MVRITESKMGASCNYGTTVAGGNGMGSNANQPNSQIICSVDTAGTFILSKTTEFKNGQLEQLREQPLPEGNVWDQMPTTKLSKQFYG
jgi:hypothetical protein